MSYTDDTGEAQTKHLIRMIQTNPKLETLYTDDTDEPRTRITSCG